MPENESINERLRRAPFVPDIQGNAIRMYEFIYPSRFAGTEILGVTSAGKY